NAAAVAVGDFNGDGKDDLAVANQGSNTVSVLLSNLDGTFRPASPSSYAVGAFPWSVAVGDFNGDGILDLAVGNGGSNTVSVLLGKVDGTFLAAVPATYAVGGFPWSVAVGDFNKDGKDDLAVTNTGPDTVSILLGNGDGTFRAPVSYASGAGDSLSHANPEGLAVDEVYGDGQVDF